MDDNSWLLLEQNIPATARADILVTPLMRKAIDIVASNRRLSRADIVRQSMLTGITQMYPEFMSIYASVVKGAKDHDQHPA